MVPTSALPPNADWTSHDIDDTSDPQNEALSKASGLTPARWYSSERPLVTHCSHSNRLHMNSRSFMFGAICGAFVGAAAGWLLSDSDEKETATRQEPLANSTSVAEAESVASTTPNVQHTSKTTDNSTTKLSSESVTDVDSVAPRPANWRDQLEAEPKDDSWAYYMEQTLLQYLSSHSSIAQFDISRVDCRTTQCLIEVIGYNESTVPVWHQVMYDIQQHPWSEFGQYATSSGAVAGRLTIVGILRRVTEDE